MQQLKTYFKPFGVTSSETITMNSTICTFGAMQFLQDTESILKVLSVGNHYFRGDVNVWVEIRDNDLANDLVRRHFQPNIEIVEPADDETPIFSLNYDCLHAIFRYLPPADLISICHTCLRLKVIAQRVFISQYKKIDFGNLDGTTKIDAMKKVLMQFGCFIIDLTVECRNYYSYNVLDVIAIYCKGSIKSLKLNGFKKYYAEISFLARMRTFIGTLESIALVDCSIDSILLSDCKHLVHLEIRSENYAYEKVFEYVYPQLKNFILGENRVHQAFPIETFLQNHTNLERIVIEPHLIERDEGNGGNERNEENEGNEGNELETLDTRQKLYSLIDHASENLQSLELDGFQIEEDMVPPLRKIVSRLKYLKLHRFGQEKTIILDLFSNENQLREMDVQPLHHTNALDTVFPKLELIKLDSLQEHFGISRRFLRKQYNLKEINMKNIQAGPSADILAFLVNDFKNLKKLKLNFKNFEYSNCLKYMKTLKRLKIYRDHPNIVTFISDMVLKESVEYLELYSHNINDSLIDAIAKYPHLRQLHLCGWLTCQVAGGPFTMFKYLLKKLYYIPFLIVTVHKVLLEDKAYDELMKLAAQNGQKLDLVSRRNMPQGYMFEMEMHAA